MANDITNEMQEMEKKAAVLAFDAELWNKRPGIVGHGHRARFMRRVKQHRFALSYIEHPEWTNKERGEAIGINVSTASKWERSASVTIILKSLRDAVVEGSIPKLQILSLKAIEDVLKNGKRSEKSNAAQFMLGGTGIVDKKSRVEVTITDPVIDELRELKRQALDTVVVREVVMEKIEKKGG